MGAQTFDLTTDIGKVRFLIGDVQGSSGPMDDEVQAALDMAGGDTDGAARILAIRMLAHRSRHADTPGPVAPGQYARDDATAVAGLQTVVKQLQGASETLPKCRIGSLGSHPSDPTYRG